jgi:signal peptidase I
MPLFSPTRNQHQTDWEGGDLPPLRMLGEKRSVLEPAVSAQVKRSQSRFELLKRNALILLCVALFSVPAYLIASRFIVTAVIIQGRSMTPTLKDGERYYLNRWSYVFGSPHRGDLVVVRDPGHNDLAVKRIIAKPYDWLNLKGGMIYINGKRLEEPYLPKEICTDTPDHKEKWIQLGRNQYYLLGDNRANSEDSRFYGVVQRKNILGQIVR